MIGNIFLREPVSNSVNLQNEPEYLHFDLNLYRSARPVFTMTAVIWSYAQSVEILLSQAPRDQWNSTAVFFF